MTDIPTTDIRRTIALNGQSMSLVGHESIVLVEMMARGEWEPHLFRIFDRYLRPDRGYVDVGAFIGTSVMYGAQLARHCWCIEPNPLVYRYLVENCVANPIIRDKVTRFEGCLWDHPGTLRLGAPVKPYGSAASLRKPEAATAWEVRAVTFEMFLEFYSIQDLNFIKMDIEGAESVVLPQMAGYLRRERPTILVSVHAFDFQDRAAELAAVIDSLDHYRHLYLRDGEREADEDPCHESSRADHRPATVRGRPQFQTTGPD